MVDGRESRKQDEKDDVKSRETKSRGLELSHRALICLSRTHVQRRHRFSTTDQRPPRFERSGGGEGREVVDKGERGRWLNSAAPYPSAALERLAIFD